MFFDDPLTLNVVTSYPRPGAEILLYATNAMNTQYYKYTVGGMNVVLISIIFGPFSFLEVFIYPNWAKFSFCYLFSFYRPLFFLFPFFPPPPLSACYYAFSPHCQTRTSLIINRFASFCSSLSRLWLLLG
jgi:hypothetical protein